MIRFENFTLKYHSKLLLTYYSAHFSRSHLIGITGPNGTGKTSFLRAIAGLNPDYTGKISLHHKDLATYSLKDLTEIRTYIPATLTCHWPLSTKQVMTIHNPKFHLDHPLLKTLALHPLLDQNFLTLSSGEKARVFLAYAVMRHTHILILDELTSHLDDTYQTIALEVLRAYAQQDKIVLLSLHQKNLALDYCDQVLCLADQHFSLLKTARPILKEVQA